MKNSRPSKIKNLKASYLQKIKENPNRKYYSKNSEIFARMFEMYCLNILRIKDEFFLSIFDASVMPEMNQEQINWMQNTLNKILVKN